MEQSLLTLTDRNQTIMNNHLKTVPSKRKYQQKVRIALNKCFISDSDAIELYENKFNTKVGYTEYLDNIIAIYITDYWKNIFLKTRYCGISYIAVEEYFVDCDAFLGCFYDFLECWNPTDCKFGEKPVCMMTDEEKQKKIENMSDDERAKFYEDMDIAGGMIDIKDDIESLLPLLEKNIKSWQDNWNVHKHDEQINQLLAHIVYKANIYMPKAVEEGLK